MSYAVRNEDPAEYRVFAPMPSASRLGEDACIARALAILHNRFSNGNLALNNPDAVKDYLRLRVAPLEHEVFGCIWLNAQNQLIKLEELFTGTLTATSVYPREVVKAALRHNAAAVILYHNHPSGRAEPSSADEHLTRHLVSALALVDVKVLDHLVVTVDQTLSFAERGMI
jgi:DNA repair protein RadC